MKAKYLVSISCIPWVILASCGDAEVMDGTGGSGGTGGLGAGGAWGQAGAGGGGEGGTAPEVPAFGLAFEEIALDGDPVLVTHFEFLPGSDEFLATTHTGQVLHYVLEDDSTRLLGEFEVEVFTETDCGLLSLTFDPDFEDNGFVYMGHCVSLTHSSIARYEFDPDDYGGISATRTDVLVVGDAAAKVGFHNVGKLGFDPRGNLWALFGDKARGSNARDPATPLGALVRLRPGDDGGYEAPDPPNPTFPGSPAIPLVYAYGLRSPWTGTLDAGGRFWVGDVGDNGDDSFEEINLVDAPGLDFGWNLRQGLCTENCAGQTDPIVTWERRPIGDLEYEDPELEASTARVAWVGVEYRETARDRYEGLMHGKVLYGDMCLGFVRGIQADAASNVVFDRHLGHLPGATGWNVGPDGFIYAVTYERCIQGLDIDTPPISKLVRARLSREE